MHGNGRKGGGLLPSCGREAGKGRGRGAAKPTWLEGGRRPAKGGGASTKGCAKVRARGGGEGKERGRGEQNATDGVAQHLPHLCAPPSPAHLHAGNTHLPTLLCAPRPRSSVHEDCACAHFSIFSVLLHITLV